MLPFSCMEQPIKSICIILSFAEQGAEPLSTCSQSNIRLFKLNAIELWELGCVRYQKKSAFGLFKNPPELLFKSS